MKDNNEILKEKLYDKLSKEYEEYLKDLKTKDIDYIIEKSYQTTMKESILKLFYPSLYDGEEKEIKALLDENHLLNCFYDKWLKVDCDISDMLIEFIWRNIEEIKEDYEKDSKIKDTER